MLTFDCHTPESYLDEVYTKYTSDEVTRILADVYINSRPESSWQHLFKTLHSHGEMAAAKEAKRHLQQNGEWDNVGSMSCTIVGGFQLTCVQPKTWSLSYFPCLYVIIYAMEHIKAPYPILV